MTVEREGLMCMLKKEGSKSVKTGYLVEEDATVIRSDDNTRKNLETKKVQKKKKRAHNIKKNEF